jgi:hypothetical protein
MILSSFNLNNKEISARKVSAISSSDYILMHDEFSEMILKSRTIFLLLEVVNNIWILLIIKYNSKMAQSSEETNKQETERFYHFFSEPLNHEKFISYSLLNTILSISFLLISIGIILIFALVSEVRCTIQDYGNACQTIEAYTDCANLITGVCYCGGSICSSNANYGTCASLYDNPSVLGRLERCCGTLYKANMCPSIATTIGAIFGYIASLFSGFQVLYTMIVKFCYYRNSINEVPNDTIQRTEGTNTYAIQQTEIVEDTIVQKDEIIDNKPLERINVESE